MLSKKDNKFTQNMFLMSELKGDSFMKIDRDIRLLEICIAKSDFIKARRIIESNLKAFTLLQTRERLSMDALALVNSVTQLNAGDNEKLYSRETLLILQYMNQLASKGKLAELKRYSNLHKDFLSDPKIYDALSSEAKIIIPAPKKVREDLVT